MNIKKNTFKDNIKFNQHFEQYFKSLNNKELKIIFDIMEVIIEENNYSNYFDSSIIDDEKNSNIKKDNVDDLNNRIRIYFLMNLLLNFIKTIQIVK